MHCFAIAESRGLVRPRASLPDDDPPCHLRAASNPLIPRPARAPANGARHAHPRRGELRATRPPGPLPLVPPDAEAPGWARRAFAWRSPCTKRSAATKLTIRLAWRSSEALPLSSSATPTPRSRASRTWSKARTQQSVKLSAESSSARIAIARECSRRRYQPVLDGTCPSTSWWIWCGACGWKPTPSSRSPTAYASCSAGTTRPACTPRPQSAPRIGQVAGSGRSRRLLLAASQLDVGPQDVRWRCAGRAGSAARSRAELTALEIARHLAFVGAAPRRLARGRPLTRLLEHDLCLATRARGKILHRVALGRAWRTRALERAPAFFIDRSSLGDIGCLLPERCIRALNCSALVAIWAPREVMSWR